MSTKQGGHHQCEGTMRNGERCGMVNTTRTLDHGWRCRHHREGTVRAGGAPATTVPSATFRGRKDVLRFTSWVLTQGAREKLNASQVSSLLKGVQLWEKVQKKLERDLFDRFKALGKRMESDKATLLDAAPQGHRLFGQALATLLEAWDAEFEQLNELAHADSRVFDEEEDE